jgi:hypothetical protein
LSFPASTLDKDKLDILQIEGYRYKFDLFFRQATSDGPPEDHEYLLLLVVSVNEIVESWIRKADGFASLAILARRSGDRAGRQAGFLLPQPGAGRVLLRAAHGTVCPGDACGGEYFKDHQGLIGTRRRPGLRPVFLAT